MSAQTHVRPLPSTNGRNAKLSPDFSQLQPSLGERVIRMAKQPTTTPRWLAFVTHGALIATIIIGLISYGRSAGRTEAALNQVKELPQLQANVDSTTAQLKEIKGLIEKQNSDRAHDSEIQSRRMDGLQTQITALGQLDAKVNAITGQMGSVWALEQSNSNSVHELKGTLNAILQQQPRKDK